MSQMTAEAYQDRVSISQHQGQPLRPSRPVAQSRSGANTSGGGSLVASGSGGGYRELAILCLVPLIMVLGNSMLIPAFQQMQSAMGVSRLQVGLLITSFSIPAGILIPVAGFVSDRIHRQKVIGISLAVYGLGGLLCGIAAATLGKPYMYIIAGRVLQGVGAAGTAPVAMAMTGDLFRGGARGKALGMIEAANGAGKVLSPIIGSIAAMLAWYAPFLVYTMLALPAAALTYYLLTDPKEGQEAPSLRQYMSRAAEIVKSKAASLAVSMLAGATVLFVLFGLLTYLSDVLEREFNLTGALKGLVLAIPVLAMSTASFLNGLWFSKKPPVCRWLVPSGLSVLAASLLAASFWNDPYWFMGTMVGAGIGSGMVLPALNTLVTSSAPLQERGIVTALYSSLRFVGVAGGPPSFCALLTIGRAPMFWVAVGICTLSAILSLLYIDVQTLIPRSQIP